MPRKRRKLTREEWIEVGNDLKDVKEALWRVTTRLLASLPVAKADRVMNLHRQVDGLLLKLETPLDQQHHDWPYRYMALEGEKQTSTANRQPALIQPLTAKSDGRCPPPAHREPSLPADLAAVVSAWPDLPEPIRAGILAMVLAAAKSIER